MTTSSATGTGAGKGSSSSKIKDENPFEQSYIQRNLKKALIEN